MTPPRQTARTPDLTPTQHRDQHHAALAARFIDDPATPRALRELAQNPRVTLRNAALPSRNLPSDSGRCVVYWMQRAQRGQNNHALDVAIAVANALELPIVVYFAAISNFPHANLRHYKFLERGLLDVEEDLAARSIGFVLRRDPHCDVAQFLHDARAAFVVCDENPMRGPEAWRRRVESAISIPFWTVDADVIVPSRLLEKAQYSAGVARPRLYRALPEFLHPHENLRPHKPWRHPRGLRHDDPHADITRGWATLDRSLPPVDAWTGGSHAAEKRLRKFTTALLTHYDRDRNHPELDGTSALSPYLHFGHIDPLTIALALNRHVRRHPHLAAARDSFFNELIAWRELSINFVRYTPTYDSTACADAWAAATIRDHDLDRRAVLYTLHRLEHAETHDELWNAAQLQMVRHGWMHNYLRMYWAKKIVEWTPNAATAMKFAIHLNDRYFLDGRDPNGYAGIAWAVLGKFDRAWGSRPIFGKRRYMSGASTARKFDSAHYIGNVDALPHIPW